MTRSPTRPSFDLAIAGGTGRAASPADGTGRATAPAPGREALTITVAEQGARRTVLDVLAAGTTSMTGPEAAVRALLERAADELAPGVARLGGQLVVVRPAVATGDPGGEATAGRGEAGGAGTRWVASCEEALACVRAGAPAGGPVVVLVDPPAAADGAARALVEAACAAAVAVIVGGACEGAREQVEVTGPASEEAVLDLVGPVRGGGAAAGLSGHPKLTELAVYLALHEEGASSRVWADALWPERPVPPQTVANRLSELRRLLGFAPDGRPRLRREGERHQLVDVRTDWAELQALASPTGGVDRWRRALGLVRGRPFTGLRDAGWTQVEGHAASMERTITDCALRTAAALLDQGQPAEAAWAAEQGLRAVPWDERLHRALMRAGAAAGNLGQVEETLRHLALALEIDGDPLGGVHPETARLYRELSGRGRTADG